MKIKKVSKIGLGLSLILFVIWLILGTSSSIAWFRDEDTIVNLLNFGDMDINMYYKDGGKYKDIDLATDVFGSEDLYEPGFTHITYLKIENAGTVDFNYDLSVVPDLATTVLGKSVLGNSINLADYIKFGLVVAPTEKELSEKLSDRESAAKYAVNKLSNYSQSGGMLTPGEVDYAALIVYFPKEIGNVANYRGDDIPSISLGIAAIANQVNAN